MIKLEYPSPKDALCQIEIGPVVLKRRIFKISSTYMYFRYFLIISPWKRVGPYIWTNLNSVQVWLKLTQLFWRRRFLNLTNVPGIFAFFCYHIPLEKDAILHCNKLSSPLPKNGFCKVWFKLAHWIPTYPPWTLFAGGGVNNPSWIWHWKKVYWNKLINLNRVITRQEAHGPHRSPEKTVQINKHIWLS